MANNKKTIESAKLENIEDVSDVDINIENKTTQEDFKKSINQNIEVDELKKQLADLQALMVKMQLGQINSNMNTSDDDTMYEIGTRCVYSTGIYSQDRRIVKEIPPFGKTIMVDNSELKELLKTPFVRDWFESDIIYFTDNSVYAKKKLNKRCELDDNSFINLIMNNSTEKVVYELNKITRDFKDEPVIHCVLYRIVELCYEGKLAKMQYDTRKEIERLFGLRIDDAQMLFREFMKIK